MVIFGLIGVDRVVGAEEEGFGTACGHLLEQQRTRCCSVACISFTNNGYSRGNGSSTRTKISSSC